MSDTFGKDPNENEEVVPVEEVTDAENVQEPSDYEFADEAEVGVEDPAIQEGADEPLAENTPPRRSLLLPLAAAVGGVALLGGLAWWQFGATTTPYVEVPRSMTAPSTMPAAKLPGAQKPALPSVAEPVAAKSDMGGAIPAVPAAPMTAGSAQPSKEAAATTPSAEDLLRAVDQLKVDTVAAKATETPALPVPAAPVPPVAAIPAATALPAAPAPAPVVAPAVKPAAAPAMPVADASKVDALSGRIDALQKQLDQISQQLGHVSNFAAASAGGEGGSKELQDRLAKLEKQVGAASREAPALSAPASVKAEASTDQTAFDEPAPVTPKAVKAPAKKPAVKKVAKAKTHTAKPAEEKTAAHSTSHWVLRSASPGQAWVASGPTSLDLRPVKVGETLPGVGRVTSIQDVDGAWVVKGTKGSIQ